MLSFVIGLQFKGKKLLMVTIVCFIFIIIPLLMYFNENSRPFKEFSIIKVSVVDDCNSNDRIFFHETSGRTELSFRQTCAV